MKVLYGKAQFICLQFSVSFHPRPESLRKVLSVALECQNLWTLTSQRIRWTHGMNFKLSNFAYKRCRTMFSKLNWIFNPITSLTWRPVLPSSELKLKRSELDWTVSGELKKWFRCWHMVWDKCDRIKLVFNKSFSLLNVTWMWQLPWSPLPPLCLPPR